MKIRTDFVSNSSSCSFTVPNVSKMVEVLKPLGELPYEYDEFSFNFRCPHKYYDEIFEILNEEKPEKNYWSSHECTMKPDDEEVFYIRSYNGFIENWQKIPDKIKSTIKDFSISCHDYNTSYVMVLSMMYDVLQLLGLEPDSKYSEISFKSDETTNNLVINLGIKLGKLKGSDNGSNSKRTSRRVV